MAYGVRILFRDKNYHNIETSDIEEARKYLAEIAVAVESKSAFRMFNKNNELVYVCNIDNVVHAMIVLLEDPK